MFNVNVNFEKGDGDVLPERPYGCFAQKVPVPFFVADFTHMDNKGYEHVTIPLRSS